MAKKVEVEICMNDAAVLAAKLFWVDNQGYEVACSTTNLEEYRVFVRSGDTGTDQQKIGEGAADPGAIISVLVFTKDI